MAICHGSLQNQTCVDVFVFTSEACFRGVCVFNNDEDENIVTCVFYVCLISRWRSLLDPGNIRLVCMCVVLASKACFLGVCVFNDDDDEISRLVLYLFA